MTERDSAYIGFLLGIFTVCVILFVFYRSRQMNELESEVDRFSRKINYLENLVTEEVLSRGKTKPVTEVPI